jgi:tryptophan synthase alpha chain
MEELLDNRISSRMEQLKEKNGRSLSTVIMIGDPDLDTTFELLDIALEVGVDVFEIGIPINDPFLDSDTMRDSMRRAIGYASDYNFYLDTLNKLRQRYPDAIFEVMIYHETVMEIGFEKFCNALIEAQMDCVLVADAVFVGEPFLHQLDEKLLSNNIFPIRFVPQRYERSQFMDLKNNGNGFIIVQTKTDEEGQRKDVLDENKNTLIEIRNYGIDSPLIFAYGIKTPEDVRKCISLGANGVLIGTKLLDTAYNQSRNEYKTLLKQFREAASPVN